MEFLQRHDFDLVCRAHMVVEDGYEFFNDRVLVTVFSAPNVGLCCFISATITNESQYCGEFDNWGAVMSVSGELLCSFELLKPLDSSALKSHIKKSRNKRQSMLNSPVSYLRPRPMDSMRSLVPCIIYLTRTNLAAACALRSSKLLILSFLCRVAKAMDRRHRYLQSTI